MKIRLVFWLLLFCGVLGAQINLNIVDPIRDKNSIQLVDKLKDIIKHNPDLYTTYANDTKVLELDLRTLKVPINAKQSRYKIAWSYTLTIRVDADNTYLLSHEMGVYDKGDAHQAAQSIYDGIVNRIKSGNVVARFNLRDYMANQAAVESEARAYAAQILKLYHDSAKGGFYDKPQLEISIANLSNLLNFTTNNGTGLTANGTYRITYATNGLIMLKGLGNVKKNGDFPLVVVVITLSSGNVTVSTEAAESLE